MWNSQNILNGPSAKLNPREGVTDGLSDLRNLIHAKFNPLKVIYLYLIQKYLVSQLIL